MVTASQDITMKKTVCTETEIRYRTPDRILLSGVFCRANDSDTIFVICHGLMGNKNTSDRVKLAWELARNGINSFRFDFRSFGESEEKDTDMCLSGERTDLETSLELLRSFGYHHIWLNGGSLGCAIVSSLDLTRFPEVEKLILWFGVFDFARMTAPFFSEENRRAVEEKGYAVIHSPRNGTEYHLGRKIFEEITGKQPWEYLQGTGIPKLFVHGTGDTIVPWELSRDTSERCRNSRLVLVKDGTHSFSGSQRELNEVIRATIDFVLSGSDDPNR